MSPEPNPEDPPAPGRRWALLAVAAALAAVALSPLEPASADGSLIEQWVRQFMTSSHVPFTHPRFDE